MKWTTEDYVVVSILAAYLAVLLVAYLYFGFKYRGGRR